MLASVAGLMALAARESRTGRLAGIETWREAAARLDAELGKTPRDGLRAQVGAVVVHAAVVEHIGARDLFTRVWARARVRPSARLAIGTRRRKLQRIELDLVTVAWTDMPRHIAARWTREDGERWREVVRSSLGDDPSCRMVSDGHTVELTTTGVLDSPGRLVAAVELVGRIAGDDLGATTVLSELPSATLVPGQLAVRLAPDDVLVEVDPATSATVMRGAAELAGARLRVRTSDELRRLEQKWATAEVATAFAASGAAVLEVSLGESRLAWSRLELDPHKLRAGLAVIRRVAGTAGDPSPYR